MKGRLARVKTAQGVPPSFFNYTKPDHRFFKNKKRILSLGFYQVFSLVNVPPSILQ
jgi:hypothetical protein